MGKRLNVSGQGRGQGETGVDVIDVNEHLSRDLARVRAKFSMDAPPGQPTLTRAWMSEVPLEEYEAEFVDTVADCLGAGLSLQDALSCWDTGDLVADVADESDITGADDDSSPSPSPTLAAPPRRPAGGHRLLVR